MFLNVMLCSFYDLCTKRLGSQRKTWTGDWDKIDDAEEPPVQECLNAAVGLMMDCV